ncbi:hypothetical protein HU200_035825 [Digitaria exilis]|uniref:RING-type E3 ubiquitin transferase n=1 Tax=Digitaria exilis TaxID=1010633 RepID=A0A835BMS1_9POAL|nr:hypothetical protein HU200_035825 [Digitaria exilis]
MASFGTDGDHGDLADQSNANQGDSGFLSSDENEQYQQPDQGAGFVSDDDEVADEDVSTPRSSTFPAAVADVEDEDEVYAFLVEAPALEVALEAAEAPADDDCCPVCLQVQRGDGEEDEATWSRVAACGHRFHVACVEQWLRVKPTCPVCRCSAGSALPSAVVEELMALGYEVTEVTLLLVDAPPRGS